MVEIAKSIHAKRARRRVLMQLLFALVIFLSGAIIGTGGTIQWIKHRGGRIGPRLDNRRTGPPDTNDFVRQWTQEYDLSTEQGEQIKQVLIRVDKIRQEAFTESRTKMETGFKEMVEGIKAAMTPEQFQKWNEEFERRMKEGRFGSGRRGGRGGGRGPNNDRDPNRPPPDGRHRDRDFNRPAGPKPLVDKKTGL